MPIMPSTFRASGKTAAETERGYDQARGSAHSRGYDARWAKASKQHLLRSPLCRYCEAGAFGQAPRTTAATLVDHLYPHQGDRVLFWASAWWVSACKPCHDGPKQSVERRGLLALHQLADRLGLPRRQG